MKTIVEMTREAGGFDATPEFLERFAALVRADAIADEREACANTAEDFLTSGRLPWVAAAAIRERSLNAGARGKA